jgi:mRNA interferase MazF
VVTEVRQGEVYWLDFGPAPGSRTAERHPCVVVQSDLFNQSRISTTVVCLITSNLRRAEAPGNIALKKGEGGLSMASVVNVSQVQTVNKAELADCVGKLAATTVDAIRSGLQILFERL